MKRRHGFTIPELLVGMMLGVIALAICWRLVATLGHSRAFQARATIAAADDWAFHAFLREQLLNTKQTLQGRATVVGTSTELTFDSRCVSVGGWLRSCRPSLQMTAVNDRCTAALDTPSGRYARTSMSRTPCAIRYLFDPADGGSWVKEWTADGKVPWAIGLLLGSDTLHFRVGP
jgi:prepilin-type N-terminal cleavage/methylation domain-containing protein